MRANNLRILHILIMLQESPRKSRVFKVRQDAQVIMLEGTSFVLTSDLSKAFVPRIQGQARQEGSRPQRLALPLDVR